MSPSHDLARHRATVAELAARLAVAQEDLRRAEAEERDTALAAALDLYAGPLTRRSHALANEYLNYLTRAWPRESELDALPECSTPKRRALHRLARSRNGEELKMRRIFDLAQKCNEEALLLHKIPSEDSAHGSKSERIDGHF